MTLSPPAFKYPCGSQYLSPWGYPCISWPSSSSCFNFVLVHWTKSMCLSDLRHFFWVWSILHNLHINACPRYSQNYIPVCPKLYDTSNKHINTNYKIVKLICVIWTYCRILKKLSTIKFYQETTRRKLLEYKLKISTPT